MPALGDASTGAALLAGIGADLFGDVPDAASRCERVVARSEPDAARARGYAELLEIYRETRARVALAVAALRRVTF